jgi:hypothetical protein
MEIYIHGVSVYFNSSLKEDTLQAHTKEKTIDTKKKISYDPSIIMRFAPYSYPALVRFIRSRESGF